MRWLLWNFIKFLFNRSSINAFAVIAYIEKYLTTKDKYDTGVYLKYAAECDERNEQ